MISTSPFITAQEKVTLMLMLYLECLLMTWLTWKTEIVPPDVLQAVACSAKSQDQGQVNWVSAFTGDHNVLPTDPVGTDKSTISVTDLKSAQASDQVVRVSDFIQRGQKTKTAERKRELSEMQLLLHEWDNLSPNKDGVLR